tara:strand:- start:43 stop:417 length:375 start_codon:yes stop_codon:yes gene_type:complete
MTNNYKNTTEDMRQAQKLMDVGYDRLRSALALLNAEHIDHARTQLEDAILMYDNANPILKKVSSNLEQVADEQTNCKQNEFETAQQEMLDAAKEYQEKFVDDAIQSGIDFCKRVTKKYRAPIGD